MITGSFFKTLDKSISIRKQELKVGWSYAPKTKEVFIYQAREIITGQPNSAIMGDEG